MSQDELAKKLDVHGAVIGRYERVEVKPSFEMAAAIAEALEVSLDYLVGNSDLHWKKMYSIKLWISKNWAQKIKLMYSPCSMLFCNRIKQRRCLRRASLT
jgi:transcriptional regulator with XRE-family HTH domain